MAVHAHCRYTKHQSHTGVGMKIHIALYLHLRYAWREDVRERTAASPPCCVIQCRHPLLVAPSHDVSTMTTLAHSTCLYQGGYDATRAHSATDCLIPAHAWSVPGIAQYARRQSAAYARSGHRIARV
eukprot:1810526-Rhodomonas_salina.2